MNKRQKKKLWKLIEEKERKLSNIGARNLGGGILLGHGWVINKNGSPVKLIKRDK